MRPHPRSKKRYRRDRKRHERRMAAIDWLTRAIFNLFPPTSWKTAMPLFEGAKENTGIIWSNVMNEPDRISFTMEIAMAVQPLPHPEGNSIVYTYNNDNDR